MKRQQGFLAIAAIVIIILFGLISAGLVHMFMSGTESSSHTRAGNESYNLANAGIEAGIYNLKSTGVCSASVTTVVANTGTYTYNCASYSVSTTLAAPITAGATSITLTNAAAFAELGTITIGTETMYYNSKSGNTLTVRRGQSGTTAQAASAGAAVIQNQYLITAEGYSPNQTQTLGKTTLKQALLYGYFAGGIQQLVYQFANTWTNLGAVPTATQPINVIACPTSGLCFAGANSGRFYQWTGGSWATLATVGSSNIFAMACPTSTQCLAAGAAGRFYSWSGGAWSNPQTIGAAGTMQGMACPTTTLCFAVGANGIIYTWNGTTWGTPVDTGGTDYTAVACPTSTICFAVGSSGNFWRWSSGSWSLDSDIGGAAVNAIACPTSTKCQAGGASGQFYKWNGAASPNSWSASTIAPNNIFSLACAGSTSCKAGDSNQAFFTWNSVTDTWSQEIAIGGNQDITAMSVLKVKLLTRN
jgi:hypothetical protein